MNREMQMGASVGTDQNGYDPETEIIMEILRQINAELDEIAEKIEGIGQID